MQLDAKHSLWSGRRGLQSQSREDHTIAKLPVPANKNGREKQAKDGSVQAFNLPQMRADSCMQMHEEKNTSGSAYGIGEKCREPSRL